MIEDPERFEPHRPLSNIYIAPNRSSMDGMDENATVRVFKCQTCEEHLFSLVLPHYFDGNLCHLVWLPKIVCQGKGQPHQMVHREKSEDANLVCVGHGIKDY
jgi:hypothetical protein